MERLRKKQANQLGTPWREGPYQEGPRVNWRGEGLMDLESVSRGWMIEEADPLERIGYGIEIIMDWDSPIPEFKLETQMWTRTQILNLNT